MPDNRPYGDSFILATYHPSAEINPLTSVSGISSAFLSSVIFDSLIKIDDKLEARPSLASSFALSDDGLKLTFHLKKGVKFHDGIECTAEDIKFTIEQFMQSGLMNPSAAALRDIDSIQIKDKYTIRITLKRLSPFLIYNLDVGILPAHLLKGKDGMDKDFGRHPVGTGPFKFISWNENEILLEANRDYFLGRPYLDRIAVRAYPNQEITWVKLMQGEGDFFFPVRPSEYMLLNQVNFLKMYNTSGLSYSMIAFNNDRRLFNDKRIRWALNYAIDKEYILKEILKGYGEIAAGTVWPRSWAYNPAVAPYPYDPQKAMSMLKEAGWKDTNGDHILDRDGKKFIFTLFINEGDEKKERVAMFIQQQMWELGVLMKIETFSITSLDFLFMGKFDAVFMDIFSHIYPDFNYNIWHSSQIGAGLNISRYRSEGVDRLLELGRAAKDRGIARQIYHEFQQEIHDNPPGVFLYWADYMFVLHRRFRGVKFAPVNMLSYINEWYVPEKEQKYRN